MGYAIHAIISKVPNFWHKSCVPFGFDILQSKLILISKIQNSGVKVVCQIPENLGKSCTLGNCHRKAEDSILWNQLPAETGT
jgi:hypothetical protein